MAKVEPIETNIIIFQLYQDRDEQSFIQILEEENIKLISMGEGKLRMVTHLEFTDGMLQRVIDVLKNMVD